MTKRELVIGVSEKLGRAQGEVSTVVQATLDIIIELLSEGHRLEIRNFGVFELKKRRARLGRNPRTGQQVQVVQKRVPVFKPGKALKQIIQAGPTYAAAAVQTPDRVAAAPLAAEANPTPNLPLEA
ncbi:MAG: integration host factor subunit beta [Candidatus Hydrogenedentes bacterium]|nr:integration host factor subunit beta [Candidatus Hydrogenedentota bacterium]